MSFGHLNTVLEASSIEEVWELHLSKMAEYGFDKLLYGFTRFYSPSNYGDLDDVLTLSNHDPDYLKRYLGEQMFVDGPALRRLQPGTNVLSWSAIFELEERGELTNRELDVLRFNRANGVVAGYTLRFDGISPRARGAIGLTARSGLDQDEVDVIWQKHGQMLELMNKVMHLKISQLPFTGTRRPLTERQTEVLEWVADGKTMQDVAQIMGLSLQTVEKHLKLAREALNVDTTTQAVAKAAILNRIFVSKSSD